jgi:hypothetical protein
MTGGMARGNARAGGRRQGRILFLVLTAVALLAGRCADDPAVAPFADSGDVAIELRFLDGALAAPLQSRGGAGAPGVAPCEPAPTGFPEAIGVEIVLQAGGGEATTHRFEIPERTESSELVIEGLAAGSGYRATMTVGTKDDPLFSGESPAFSILPGSRATVSVPLLPIGRRAVLAVGKPVAAADDVTIPILVANSLPLRGVELDLCYDPEVLEPVAAAAAGPRVADFRGAGGEPLESGIYRALLWSEHGAARIASGQDQVLELHFRFRAGVPAGTATILVFTAALVTDAADQPPFTTYFFDGQVSR